MTAVRHHALWLLGVLLLAAIGCQAPPQPAGPTLGSVPAQTPNQVNHLWDSIETTLLAFNFDIDRRDRVSGIVTTLGDTSANWFEIWRVQPSPAYYWWESNLHTIERRADVFVRQTPTGDCELEVKVDRFRRSMEERQVNNAAAAMRLYSAEAPTISGRMLRPFESAYWIHLGRDGTMEQAILDAIVKEFNKPAATAPAS